MNIKALFPFAAIALVFLLSACALITPLAEPTPNLQPTIDALVDQRLAEKEKEAQLKKKTGSSETLNVAWAPTPTPSLDEEAAIRAVSEYIEPYSGTAFGAEYLGGNSWTVQSYGWRFFPDRGTNELILVHWDVNGSFAPPIVSPKDDAEEWDAFLRGRPELVDWVQLTWCLLGKIPA